MDFDLNLPSGRVRARRWGAEGAPLLLCIHGLSANLCGFTYLAEHLAGPHRQVVAIDLRGRGRSEITPPGTYGLDNHARDVIDVADALSVDEFDVAGWSLGALISMRVALRHPARLRSVTLIDHAGPSDPAALAPIRSGLDRLDAVVPTPDYYLQAIRAAGVIEPWSEFWDGYYTYELEQFDDGLWRPSTFRGAAEEDLYQEWPSDWSDHWRALTMPTLLVRAMKPLNGGLIVPDQAVASLLATNPTVRVVETPGSNHFTCHHRSRDARGDRSRMFRMTVDDVFVIRGRGVVATGRVEYGQLRVGDEVQINGVATARVDGIEAFRKKLDEATTGDNIGVLFSSLDKGAVVRGDVLSSAVVI